MPTLSSIPTPAFVVDLPRVQSNTERMLSKAKRSGVSFRPHVKTHKTAEIARMQHGGSEGAITVSTLAEAEFMAGAGFRDITYAFPIAASKLGRVARLSQRIERLNLLLDHHETLRAIEEFAAAEGVVFDAFLKVDCGYGRAGVDPTSEDALELLRACRRSPALRLHGLVTHAGHSYDVLTREEVERIAAQETAAVGLLASRAGEEGRGLVRSIGSTPTASVVERFTECDEARPGNYVFYDAFQATLGSCQWNDCAATVVATVVGVYPRGKRAIIDAGALALSKDLSPAHLAPASGYGRVCSLDLRPLPMTISALSQEHGKVRYEGEPPTIGERVRVIPNHSCLTAALFERYAVTDGENVIAEWVPCRGW